MNEKYVSAEGRVETLGWPATNGANPPMNIGELYYPSIPVSVNAVAYNTIFDYNATFTADAAFGPDANTSFSFSLEPLTAKNGGDGTTAGEVPVLFGLDLPPSSFKDVAPCVPSEEVICPPTGGGSSGGTTRRQAQLLPRPSENAEPFIAVTNDANGNLTRNEAEARMAAWSPQARAFWDAFYQEVYPDEYDGELGNLAGGAGGSPAKMVGQRADLLRAAAAGYVRTRDTSLDLETLLSLIDETEPFLTVHQDRVQFVAQTAAMAAPSLRLTTYPNPTTARVSISTATNEPALVRVFDSLGREVFSATALPGATVEWDLRSASGQRVGPGTYIVQVTSGTQRETRTLSVL